MPLSVRQSVLATIREFQMIAPGDRVAVACSGGADSTALLFILQELAEPIGCVLSVAHVNHGLRGEESDADERFVRSLAGRLDLPCYVERTGAARAASGAGVNQEAMARELRRSFFRALIASGRATRVALAHTADDQAETVLHRFVRGAGTRGLSGIHPVLEGALIRPLLRTRRQALRDWLATRAENWREDSSNQDLRFTRNRIRHEALPLLSQFNPNIVETLAQAADRARAEEEFWEDYLRPLRGQWCRVEGAKVTLEMDALRQAPPAVAYRVLRWALGQVAAAGADWRHIHGLLEWALHGQSGQRFVLPRGVEALREFSHLIIQRASRTPMARTLPRAYQYAVQVPGIVRVKEAGLTLRFDLVPPAELRGYNECGDTLLDGRIIGSPLLLRSWRAGDAYRPEGHRRRQKVQELFQRRRIPLRERAGWPVLVWDKQVIWVRGFAVAEGLGASPASASCVAIREVGLE